LVYHPSHHSFKKFNVITLLKPKHFSADYGWRFGSLSPTTPIAIAISTHSSQILTPSQTINMTTSSDVHKQKEHCIMVVTSSLFDNRRNSLACNTGLSAPIALD